VKDRKKLPTESLVRIFVNGDFSGSLLCTPRDVKELAVGWLYNEGHIQSVNEIGSLAACEDIQDVHVNLTNGRKFEQSKDRKIRTSACMGGEMSFEQFRNDMPRLDGGPRVSLGCLKSLMKRTLALALFYRETGGVHCAALASAVGEKLLAVFEDVGRHNAFDKTIGRLLLARFPPEEKVLLTSGRISSEMALKAARSRIPIIATITTGTDLAVRIADDAGLTVVCRVLSASPMVCCGGQRIVRGETYLENSIQSKDHPGRDISLREEKNLDP
jgi:FdhD protein